MLHCVFFLFAICGPHPLPKMFWAESAALTVASIADGVETARDSRQGFPERFFPRGSAEVIGRYPTAGSYTLAFAPIQAAQEWTGACLERSRRKWARAAGHVLLLGSAAAHAYGAAHNAGLGIQERK